MPLVTPTSLGTPATDQPAGFSRNVWDLQVFNGRIYLGAGDSEANTGPVTVRYYNPSTPGFATHATSGAAGGTPTVNSEQIFAVRALGSTLYIPAHDPRTSNASRWYRIDSPPTGAFVEHATGPFDLHWYDVLLDGSVLVAVGTISATLNNLATSSDDGVNWTQIAPSSETPTDGLVATRGGAYALMALGSTVYAGGLFYRTGTLPADGLFHARYINWARKTGTTSFAVPDFTTALGMWPGFEEMQDELAGGLYGLFPVKGVNLGSQLLYIGAQPQSTTWMPWADALFRCTTFGSASHIALPNAPTSRDTLVSGGTAYVLASIDNGSDFTNYVYSSTDLVTWDEVLSFDHAGFARSFELLDGIWYFGIGQDEAGSSGPAGEILSFDTSILGEALVAGGSDYIENAILVWLKGTTFPSAPATVYVSLHTADPADTGASEVSGGSYARVAVTTSSGFSAVGAGAGTAKQITNAGAVTFPAPTANWGTATYFGVWDAATTGNFLVGGALSASHVINNGDGAPSFGIGALTVSAD